MDTTRVRLNGVRSARRYSGRGKAENDSGADFTAKTLRQVVVCVLLALTAVGVSKVDIPAFRFASEKVKTMLFYTVDYRALAEKITESTAGLWKTSEEVEDTDVQAIDSGEEYVESTD